MIRKVFSIIFCALILYQLAAAEQASLITATTDDFTIRNDIKFLMTMDEVEAKETITPKNGMYSMYDHSIQIAGDMAGYGDVNGEYIFNNDLKLISFAYSFAGSVLEPKSINQVVADYLSTEESLTEKYGDSLTSVSGYYSDYLKKYAEIIASVNDSGIINFSERFIKINSGGYVKIEHWTGYSNLKTVVFTDHYVQYTYYSDEELSIVLADYEKKQNQKNTDY